MITKIKQPLVIDADGLNALSGFSHLLKDRQAATIITPHPVEFCRLLNMDLATLKQDWQNIVLNFAKEHSCVVVLKFAPAVVTDGSSFYENTSGNPGMATAGSGDVLTGVITSLLGQSFSAFEAAQLGVWLHGYAGDIACEEIGEISMIASDILQCLAKAFKNYQSLSEKM